MASAIMRTTAWLALLSSLLLLTSAQTVLETDAPFWTYTSRFQRSLSASSYTRVNGETTTYYLSRTRTISSSVTPTATPYSTSTAGRYVRYDDLELVYAYYPVDAVGESDLLPDTIYDSSATRIRTSTAASTYTYTAFMMAVTYTAPATCTQQFTWTGNETVTVPSQVRDQVSPIAKVTPKMTTYRTYNIYPSETWYLKAGAAPLTTSKAFYYSNYIASCSTPSSTSTGRPVNGNYYSGGDNDDISMCSWYSGCTSLHVWIIIIATIIPSLLLFGFLESWFWFRRLMLGKGCLRFGTVSWILISLWVACFTRTQSARSKEDQKLLREKWNQTGSGEAFKLWWKWGFRHRYPVERLGQYSRNTVGIVPEGQPLPQPQMGQVKPNMYAAGATPTGMVQVPQWQPLYHPPPQGWVPASNGQGHAVPAAGQGFAPGQGYAMPAPGQGYAMPAPSQAFVPLPHGTPVHYGEHYGGQTKEASSISVSPIQQPAGPPTTIPPPVNTPSPALDAVVSPQADHQRAAPPPLGQLSPAPQQLQASPPTTQNPQTQGPPQGPM